MSTESTASKTTAVFTPASAPVTPVTFCYTSVKLFGFDLDDKIDVSTNCDTLSGSTVGPKSFEPAGLYEITDATFTCPIDLTVIEQLEGLLGNAGTLVFTSQYTSAVKTIANVWISGVDVNDWDINSRGDYTVTFESGGTSPAIT